MAAEDSAVPVSVGLAEEAGLKEEALRDEEVAWDLSFQEAESEDSEDEDLLWDRAEELRPLNADDMEDSTSRTSPQPAGTAPFESVDTVVEAMPADPPPAQQEPRLEAAEVPAAALAPAAAEPLVPEPAVHPPAPQAGRAAPKRGATSAAAAAVQTPWGRIAFYAGSNLFQATCARQGSLESASVACADASSTIKIHPQLLHKEKKNKQKKRLDQP